MSGQASADAERRVPPCNVHEKPKITSVPLSIPITDYMACEGGDALAQYDLGIGIDDYNEAACAVFKAMMKAYQHELVRALGR